jgi:hypothetical protein
MPDRDARLADVHAGLVALEAKRRAEQPVLEKVGVVASPVVAVETGSLTGGQWVTVVLMLALLVVAFVAWR